MPNQNPHEVAARSKKVLKLVAAVDRIAAEQKFAEGNVALAVALESFGLREWAEVARRAEVHVPSDQTITEVRAHFANRLSALDRASMAMAEGGASGSTEPDEAMEFLRPEDKALFREIQERAALNSLDHAKGRGL